MPHIVTRTTSDTKRDGFTYTGMPEATDTQHAGHVLKGFYVARLKGGTKLHLRSMGCVDALCGAEPTHKASGRMRDRSGWETYVQTSKHRATCQKCLTFFTKHYA